MAEAIEAREALSAAGARLQDAFERLRSRNSRADLLRSRPVEHLVAPLLLRLASDDAALQTWLNEVVALQTLLRLTGQLCAHSREERAALFRAGCFPKLARRLMVAFAAELSGPRAASLRLHTLRALFNFVAQHEDGQAAVWRDVLCLAGDGEGPPLLPDALADAESEDSFAGILYNCVLCSPQRRRELAARGMLVAAAVELDPQESGDESASARFGALLLETLLAHEPDFLAGALAAATTRGPEKLARFLCAFHHAHKHMPLRGAEALARWLAASREGAPNAPDALCVMHALECLSGAVSHAWGNAPAARKTLLLDTGLAEWLATLLAGLAERTRLLAARGGEDEGEAKRPPAIRAPASGALWTNTGAVKLAALRTAANLVFVDPDAVRADGDEPAATALGRLGAIEAILALTAVDPDAPLAREWAVMALRSLLAGSAANRDRLASLRAERVVDTAELRALGLEAHVDSATGKIALQRRQG